MSTGIETQKEAPTASEALRNPVRVRILEALNGVDMSPIQFLNSGMVSEVASLIGKNPEAALSHISYHFRVLAKAGCIEVVETIPRRGSVEHIYRAKARAQFDEAQWADLDLAERATISKVTFQSFLAQIEGSMLSGTFDLRPDRCQAWLSLELDAQGWTELISSLESCWAEMEEIRQICAKRLQDTQEETIPATIGLFGFESPPLPPQPKPRV